MFFTIVGALTVAIWIMKLIDMLEKGNRNRGGR